MSRPHLKLPQGEKHFRWRGGDLSRLEGLSDAVFALSLTLIIVSLEAPSSFENLVATLKQIPVFAACFAILLMIWYYHFQFHRRYGLEDFGTFVLNSFLLFLILMYVYPLRFVFSGLLSENGLNQVSESQGQQLMAIYGAGVTGIFCVLTLLNVRAWLKRRELRLDEPELLLTKQTILAHIFSASIGALSMLLVLASKYWGLPLAFSGLVYFLMGPVHGFLGYWGAKRVEALALEPSPPSEPVKKESEPRQDRRPPRRRGRYRPRSRDRNKDRS